MRIAEPREPAVARDLLDREPRRDVRPADLVIREHLADRALDVAIERIGLVAPRSLEDRPQRARVADQEAARARRGEIELTAGNAARALTYGREALAIAVDQPTFPCAYRARIASALLAAGDAPAALAESTEAMQLMDLHGRPEEGEMGVRLAHARALHANGKLDEAREVIADLEKRVTAAAALITDPDLRRSFLEGVPEHALGLSLAQMWK